MVIAVNIDSLVIAINIIFVVIAINTDSKLLQIAKYFLTM